MKQQITQKPSCQKNYLITCKLVWAGFWTIGFGVVVVEGGGLFKASKQFVGAGVSSPQHHTCRFAASQIWLLKFVNKMR